MLRCNYLKATYPDMEDNFRLSFVLADGVICISDTTRNDYLTYFQDEPNLQGKPVVTIRPAPKIGSAVPKVDAKVPQIDSTVQQFNSTVSESMELPFDRYILIMGSGFKHKMLKETIEAVRSSGFNYIVVGYGGGELLHPNVYGYGGGDITDEHMAYLYHKCEMMIFPSCYEGFGLPVYEALKENKPIILYDNAMNRELYEFLPQFSAFFHFFCNFGEIPDLIEAASGKEYTAGIITWTWDKHAEALDGFIGQLFEKEADIDKLNHRWHCFNTLEHTSALYIEEIRAIEAYRRDLEFVVNPLRAELLSLHTQFGEYKLFPLLRFAFKEHVKNRYKKLFKAVKRKYSKK